MAAPAGRHGPQTSGVVGPNSTIIGVAVVERLELWKNIEAVAPIEDPAHRQALRDLLLFMWQDNRQAWELDREGTWRQRSAERPTPITATPWRASCSAAAKPMAGMTAAPLAAAKEV